MPFKARESGNYASPCRTSLVSTIAVVQLLQNRTYIGNAHYSVDTVELSS